MRRCTVSWYITIIVPTVISTTAAGNFQIRSMVFDPPATLFCRPHDEQRRVRQTALLVFTHQERSHLVSSKTSRVVGVATAHTVATQHALARAFGSESATLHVDDD